MKKLALVTAGYKGLGLGWTTYLTSKAYNVIIAGRAMEKARAISEKLNQEGYTTYSIELDVSNEASIQNCANYVRENFGAIDLIVNNAGINPKDFSDKEKSKAGFYLDHLDSDVMLDVYRVNSLGPILMVKHFKDFLMKGEEKKVLNISSWLGSVSNLSFGGHYGYVSSKNLLNVLNKSMALEVRDSGIICVNVNPGWVKTAMGGQKAQFEPVASAENVYRNVLEKVTIEDTGKFFNYDGSIHPW